MERTSLRKPRQHFDVATHPGHVTFDDGKEMRRNLAWMNYTEARWEYAEPDIIKVEIGDWAIVITGYNLAPLFAALEEQTLVRVRAQPELKLDRVFLQPVPRHARAAAVDSEFHGNLHRGTG